MSLVPHNDRPARRWTGFAVDSASRAAARDDRARPRLGSAGSHDRVRRIDGRLVTAAKLPAGGAANFTLHLEATTDPGAVTLLAEQRYPDGRAVRSPVALTVVPGDEEASGDAYLWAIVIGLGIVVFAVIGLVAWRALRR